MLCRTFNLISHVLSRSGNPPGYCVASCAGGCDSTHGSCYNSPNSCYCDYYMGGPSCNIGEVDFIPIFHAPCNFFGCALQLSLVHANCLKYQLIIAVISSSLWQPLFNVVPRQSGSRVLYLLFFKRAVSALRLLSTPEQLRTGVKCPTVSS